MNFNLRLEEVDQLGVAVCFSIGRATRKCP
jgi:hypothetical protein